MRGLNTHFDQVPIKIVKQITQKELREDSEGPTVVDIGGDGLARKLNRLRVTRRTERLR